MPAPSLSVQKRIIIIRRQPLASRTVDRLHQEFDTEISSGNLSAVALPLFELEDTGADLPAAASGNTADGAHDGTIVTSQSVIEILVSRGISRTEKLFQLPLFCVGERTAGVARKAGFSTVISAEGSAADLARLIAERSDGGARYLYLCGEDRAFDMRAVLASSNCDVQELELYRVANKMPEEPDIERSFNKKFIRLVVPLYSARQAEHFLKNCFPKIGSSVANLVDIIAISQTVAETCCKYFSGRIITTTEPNEASVFAAINQWVDD